MASIKSSIVEKPDSEAEDNFSELCGVEKEDSFSGTSEEASNINEDKVDSDSTSSSTSDETLSNLDVEDVDNKSDDTSSNSTSFSARYIESRYDYESFTNYIKYT